MKVKIFKCQTSLVKTQLHLHSLNSDPLGILLLTDGMLVIQWSAEDLRCLYIEALA